jgi:hypothetical protein
VAGFEARSTRLEGPYDPIGKFEAIMDGVSEGGRDRFYSGNFDEMMGAWTTIHGAVTA